MYLSIRLAGDVSIHNHVFKVWPEEVGPLSQGERDAHRLLQTLLDRSLTPGRAAPGSHTRTKRLYADDSSIYTAEHFGINATKLGNCLILTRGNKGFCKCRNICSP